MKKYTYRVVDVFSEHPLEGNPLAVFPDAAGLDDVLMQKIAKELNLSETTFVLPATRPDCAANVRIFTPTREMTFAGHPTIGTSFVLLEEGRVPRGQTNFALEEKVGVVPIEVERSRGGRPLLWLTTPPIRFGRTFDRALCAQVLGLRAKDMLESVPQLITAGNPAIFIGVKNKTAVDRAWVDLHGMQALRRGLRETVCVFVFAPTPEGAYSRMFAPEIGIAEDPASGSLTGPLAAYLMQHGHQAGAAGSRFWSEQGTKMGRRSILHVRINGPQGIGGIAVGGSVTPIIEGTLTI